MDEKAGKGGNETPVTRSSSDENERTKKENKGKKEVSALGSSSSLDTVMGPLTEDKKKGRFGALKSSFRKEGIFNIKKKGQSKAQELESWVDNVEETSKVAAGKASQIGEGDESLGSKSARKKKTKKSHSLVRKLSLSKFRASEPRHTPEGGDQSSQESQLSHSESAPATARKEYLVEKKGEDLIGKPVSTVNVLQLKSPQFTIKASKQHKDSEDLLSPERKAALKEHFARVERAILEQEKELAKRSETTAKQGDLLRKAGLVVKSDSESASSSPKSSPSSFQHHRLSLLEERRSFLQRRRPESSPSTSGETVVAVTVVDEEHQEKKKPVNQDSDEQRKKTRQISVRKFDTFSTFEGTFHEDTGIGDLAGTEEDRPDCYDKQSENVHDKMAQAESGVKTPTIGQESPSSPNSAANPAIAEKREHLYKILVIGELGAGKTSIIKRYVHQFFSQHYRATIGVDFALKVLNWDPHTIIRLQLWDIAGQERFGNMTRVYYKEAVGAFIVFDVTRSATLEAVVKWKQDLDSKVQLPDGSPIPCVLLANKCDQQKEGLVNNSTKMEEYCKERNFAGWFETSAKENINIEEAARFLVNKILQNDIIMKGSDSQDQLDGERFSLQQSPNNRKKSCSC